MELVSQDFPKVSLERAKNNKKLVKKTRSATRMAIRNGFRKVALLLSLIRIGLLTLSLFSMSNGRIPCDLTQKECMAYGSLSKDGEVIKWDDEHSGVFELRDQVFEMSDEVFNKYWSKEH